MEHFIADHFAEHGWTWKVGGKDVVPSPQDISDAVDQCVRTLSEEDVNTEIEVGRLIVKKSTPTTYDVYVFVGEA